MLALDDAREDHGEVAALLVRAPRHERNQDVQPRLAARLAKRRQTDLIAQIMQ